MDSLVVYKLLLCSLHSGGTRSYGGTVIRTDPTKIIKDHLYFLFNIQGLFSGGGGRET